MTSLLRGLADQATRQSGLSVEISKIWQLLYFASRDRESGLSWHLVEQFTRVIRQGNSGPEDVKTLIAYARPRLEPSEPSNFVNVENQFSNDPRQWVIWEFRAASGSVDHSIQKISRELLSTLPTELLAQIITESTHALVQALDLAQKAGWIRNGYDFANSSVARVALI